VPRDIVCDRSERFHLRLSVAEREYLDRMARAAGVSRSDYIRLRLFGTTTFGVVFEQDQTDKPKPDGDD
jgi:hypothetical protein